MISLTFRFCDNLGLPPSVLSLARQILGMLETLEERSGQARRVVEMRKILEEEMGNNGKDDAREVNLDYASPRVMQTGSQPQIAVV